MSERTVLKPIYLFPTSKLWSKMRLMLDRSREITNQKDIAELKWKNFAKIAIHPKNEVINLSHCPNDKEFHLCGPFHRNCTRKILERH